MLREIHELVQEGLPESPELRALDTIVLYIVEALVEDQERASTALQAPDADSGEADTGSHRAVPASDA